MVQFSRRRFLGYSAAVAGGALVGPVLLQSLLTGGAQSVPGDIARQAARGEGGYGPLSPSANCPDLALPGGFRCRKFGTAGSPMSDGVPTPPAHDGMAAFSLPNGNIRLIRNHEVRGAPASSAVFGNPSTAYDPRAGGGITSLEVRPGGDRELVRDFASLNGTLVNCAGGPTPWGSWLTCEETTEGTNAGWARPHGYVFEVPKAAEEEVNAVPLKAMGRFVHEAVAVDPSTGIVYETEDRARSGFYRFIPNNRGRLADGGRLQMLALRGNTDNYDTRTGQQVGTPLPVDWVDIDDPDPANAEADLLAVYKQGAARGGAIFDRLEGAWYGSGSIYFVSTTGGNAGLGQVWEYNPRGSSGGQLTLVFESPGADVLNGPDNMTVSPRGGLLLCEDGDGQPYLRGLTASGKKFDFARNLANDNEFAGATFSPDGQTLFVNIQSPGATYAIWGPWDQGAL